MNYYAILCLAYLLFGRQDKLKNLIIRPQGIGDIVLMIPALRSLCKNYPNDEFTLLCYKGFGLVLPPELNIKTIEFPRHAGIIDTFKLIKKIRREKFDRVFDLFGNPRTAIQVLLSGIKKRYGFGYRFRGIVYNNKFDRTIDGGRTHQVNLYCKFFKKFGFNCEYCLPNLKMPKEVLKKAKMAIPEEFLDNRLLIAVNPNSTFPTRAWPKENIIKFINLWYKETKAPVMLTWGAGEEEISKSIIAEVGADKAFMHKAVKLNEFVALLSLLDLFISGDSGPMHMAWAVGTPVIALFGPTTAADVEPLGEKNTTIVAKEIDCLFCHKEYCNTKKCMYAISSEQVLKVALTKARDVQATNRHE